MSMSLGFDSLAVTDTDLSADSQKFQQWLAKGYHGEMHYMQTHGEKRWQPEKLVDGTIRVICVKMNYWPNDDAKAALNNTQIGYISRYALGRDYHKLIRRRLQKLSERIQQLVGEFGYRVFCDSAPVLEKPLAQKAGLGWMGKHTNLINQNEGSWFFLAEIYTDLPLPIDPPINEEHCGSCTQCIDVCPTKAIVAPFVVDARKCISYHTIELKSAIPVEFRKAMGNRIYGCDDCQLFCPWNKFSKKTKEIDFLPKNNLNELNLSESFQWDKKTFECKTEGSAIRRIGHERWLRNIAVALGNAQTSSHVIKVLKSRLHEPSSLVAEHVEWALNQHANKDSDNNVDYTADE